MTGMNWHRKQIWLFRYQKVYVQINFTEYCGAIIINAICFYGEKFYFNPEH
jgi:hypothetical protein